MYIATFYTHYGAMTFHTNIRNYDAKAKMMPVPRALSAACGVCVRFDVDHCEAMQETIPEDLEGLYEYVNNEFRTIFEVEEA